MRHETYKAPRAYNGFLLWILFNKIETRVSLYLAPLDLSYSQFMLLMAIFWLQKKTSTLTQHDLAVYLSVGDMTISKSLRKLVRLGYIQIRAHAKDKRAHALFLTEKINTVLPVLDNILRDEQKLLTKKQGGELHSLLELLLRRFDGAK